MNNGGLMALGDNLYSETGLGPADTGSPGQQGFGEFTRVFLKHQMWILLKKMIAMIVAQGI